MALVLALGFVVSVEVGCMKCGENIAERVAEEAAEAIVESRTGENVEIDAAGEVDISGLAEFLRYPGAKATGKVSMSSPEGKGTVWTLETADAVAKTGEWYRAAFAGQGWDEKGEMETGESLMLMRTTQGDKEAVTVLIASDDGKTTISITHLLK